MTSFYYSLGIIFLFTSLFLPSPAFGIVGLTGIYYLFNTPIGNMLSGNSPAWYTTFFTLDILMVALMLWAKEPVLYIAAAAFALGATLTMTTYCGWSIGHRLYGVLSSMVNAAVLASMAIYVVKVLS